MATGRRPAIDDLNLPAAGIEAGKKGITVDTSLKINISHIWAAGDITGTFLFTFVAGEQGKELMISYASLSVIESTMLNNK